MGTWVLYPSLSQDAEILLNRLRIYYLTRKTVLWSYLQTERCHPFPFWRRGACCEVSISDSAVFTRNTWDKTCRETCDINIILTHASTRTHTHKHTPHMKTQLENLRLSQTHQKVNIRKLLPIRGSWVKCKDQRSTQTCYSNRLYVIVQCVSKDEYKSVFNRSISWP
jgi:hypothetical protein